MALDAKFGIVNPFWIFQHIPASNSLDCPYLRPVFYSRRKLWTGKMELDTNSATPWSNPRNYPRDRDVASAVLEIQVDTPKSGPT